MNQIFIKGLELSELFYKEAVRPILVKHFSGLAYSAALIGPGSDVLSFDTPQSTDHDWGPRLMLFLAESDYEACQTEIDQRLRQELPNEIHGYPTNFGRHADNTRVMTATESGSINHGVTFLTVDSFFRQLLNFDPTCDIQAMDWVSVPEYHLLMLTAGRVFHDGLGHLEPIRAKLRYYPHAVWLYLLAAQWRRIAQEEAFVGRDGQVGDELGSRLVAARLVHDLMRLCFLIDRQYTPYSKWFGKAFAQLHCAEKIAPALMYTLAAHSWQEREEYLITAYEVVARLHNDLGVTEPLPTQVSQFHARPFLVIHADRFVDAIRAAITSQEVLALPEHLGSIDQFIDSTDALSHFQRFKRVYEK